MPSYVALAVEHEGVGTGRVAGCHRSGGLAEPVAAVVDDLVEDRVAT